MVILVVSALNLKQEKEQNFVFVILFFLFVFICPKCHYWVCLICLFLCLMQYCKGKSIYKIGLSLADIVLELSACRNRALWQQSNSDYNNIKIQFWTTILLSWHFKCLTKVTIILKLNCYY